MTYHVVNNPINAIFAWDEDCGFASLLSIITHLSKGPILNNACAKFLDINSKIYKTFYESPLVEGVDYSNYKLVLFGRNPYCKLVSQYLSKYVFLNSERSVTDFTLTFEQFINNISNQAEAGFDSFDSLWQQINKHNNKRTTHVVMLPDSPLPDNMVFHDKISVQEIYKFCWRKNLYLQIDRLFSHDENPSLLNAKKCLSSLYKMVPEQLNLLISSDVLLDTASFFSNKLKLTADNLVADELNFYKNRGIICTI